MKNTMLGVIDATTSFDAIKDLSEVRSLAAIPFGGRYRLIDFALSNMVNSGMTSVAIFPKYQYRSLMDHLGSGRNWDLNRKRDGLFFFPPPYYTENDETASCFHYFKFHLDYFHRSKQKYVVVSNSNIVCNLNFSHMLERHQFTGADITEVCQDGKPLDIYILSKDLLLELVDYQDPVKHQTVCEVIRECKPNLSIQCYEYTGYAAVIRSVEDYYRHSLELLQPEVWKQLFLNACPIYTKVKDEPPTRYCKNAMIKNAQIANGCQIEGHVENSIISRSVKIGKGAVIKNSIIMQKSVIEENAYIDGAIIDKDVLVGENAKIIRDESSPIVIKKGTKQGELMNS